jgi:hypothetical protein
MSEIMTWADMHRIWATIDAERQAHAETQRLLEDLTPGGSEFAGDPKRCAQFVRERLATNIEFVKAARLAERERDEARREVERLREITEAAQKLSVELQDNYIEAVRSEWGNTNAAVLEHWRTQLRDALAKLEADHA